MTQVGVALGGGGAKGLAHVLILEALDELGIRPSCVVGTSIGAVIGVLYCAGLSGREIRESIVRTVGYEDAFPPRLPDHQKVFKWLEFVATQFKGTGLLKAEGLVSFLLESIKVESFDQLKIPLRVVAADFWTREEVVLDQGPLRPAVQASMSLPGLMSPVLLDQRVLVDGGAVNPVPFDLLPADCTLTVAVDVIGVRTPTENSLPSLSEAVFNTFQIMEKSIVRAKLRTGQPSIYVNVDVVDVRILEFFKAQQIFSQAETAKSLFKRELEEQISRIA